MKIKTWNWTAVLEMELTQRSVCGPPPDSANTHPERNKFGPRKRTPNVRPKSEETRRAASFQ